ncbi:MAG: phosphatidate cytidylyltransferase [Cytophagaceae bacterium]
MSKPLDKLRRMGNLKQRIIAGLIGAFIILFSICYSEWTYFALFFLITYFTLNEFYNLLRLADIKPNKAFGILAGVSIFSVVFLIEKKVIDYHFYYLLLPFLFLLFLFELFQTNEKPFVNIAFTFLGVIYISIPFALLNVSAFFQDEYNFKIILGILFLLWANDIGGYIAGMALGKTKLFFRISPKKTWEGSIGGGLFCLFTALGLSVFIEDLNTIHWIIVSVIVIVLGSYGDLVESYLKRSLSIKDSSQAIPGHGGFLDRFDGLLLASPFIAAFIKLFT